MFNRRITSQEADNKQLQQYNTQMEMVERRILERQQQNIDLLLGDLPKLHTEFLSLGMHSSAAQARRIMIAHNPTKPHVTGQMVEELSNRVHDDLQGLFFLALDAADEELFEEPLRKWEKVVSRFPDARDDIDEAGKCLALERYPATSFHLMRVTEAGVLALGRLIDPNDYKPQFGSVLRKIDNLLQKTKWHDWPDNAKPHKKLFEDVLPRLYAVKDSWRDKVAHFDVHIIPTDTVSNKERALDIYNSTLSLMRLLAERLPQ